MITFIRVVLGFMLVLTALFLILLVLIQRGRGGGLTGALGGAGGQSAFGTKAGDVFTRITVGVAAFWIGLCILSLNVLGERQSLFSPTLGGNAPQAVTPQTRPAAPPAAQPATPVDIQLAPESPAEESAKPPVAEPETGAAAPAAPEGPATPAAPAAEPPAAAPAADPAAAAPAPPAE